MKNKKKLQNVQKEMEETKYEEQVNNILQLKKNTAATIATVRNGNERRNKKKREEFKEREARFRDLLDQGEG
jgi:hypothetical protein